MKYFILLLFVFSCSGAYAQTMGDTTVIETVFNKNAVHKDGYEAGSKIIDIPAEAAAKMDRKKVRITGLNIAPVKVTAEQARTYQGRFEHLPDGTIMTSGVGFNVLSVFAWNKKKHIWELVYKKQ